MKKLQMLRVVSRLERGMRQMLRRQAPDILDSVKALGLSMFGRRTETKILIRYYRERRPVIAENMRKHGMVRGARKQRRGLCQ